MNTAGRKWINYEIRKAWETRKGLLGIYIHGLRDLQGCQGIKGLNPFIEFNLNGTPLSSIVNAHDPPYVDSKQVYRCIASNLGNWIEQAIQIREQYN